MKHLILALAILPLTAFAGTDMECKSTGATMTEISISITSSTSVLDAESIVQIVSKGKRTYTFQAQGTREMVADQNHLNLNLKTLLEGTADLDPQGAEARLEIDTVESSGMRVPAAQGTLYILNAGRFPTVLSLESYALTGCTGVL